MLKTVREAELTGSPLKGLILSRLSFNDAKIKFTDLRVYAPEEYSESISNILYTAKAHPEVAVPRSGVALMAKSVYQVDHVNLTATKYPSLLAACKDPNT